MTKKIAAPKDATKKPEAIETPEEVATEATEEVTNEEEVNVTKTNGNGSYGKRKVKLADMPTVEFTKAAFGSSTQRLWQRR